MTLEVVFARQYGGTLGGETGNMARVNFEEHGFGDGRLTRLARAFGNGSSIREAVGTLTVLWHDSQEELRISGTKEEVIDWCRAESDEVGERLFAGLLKAKYLVPIEVGKFAGQFEIRGNKVQIESRMKNMARAKKGGKSTHEKWRLLKKENESEDLTEGLKPSALVGLKPSNAVQSSTSQCSTDQIKSDPKKGAPEKNLPAVRLKAAPPIGVNLVIGRYVELWQGRWKAKRHLSGKEIGLLQTFTRDHGQVNAVKLVEAYLQMPDAWFVTKRHDVGTLIGNLAAVSHFLETGRLVTRKDVKNLDSTVHTQNLLDAIDRGEI